MRRLLFALGVLITRCAEDTSAFDAKPGDRLDVVMAPADCDREHSPVFTFVGREWVVCFDMDF